MTELDKSQVLPFVLAGNATFTLEPGKTGKYFTYKMTKYKSDDNAYFVELLRGCDNTQDYTYIGTYYRDTKYLHLNKVYKDKEEYTLPKSIRAIRYFIKNIDDIPDILHIYHEGKCAKCGRKLTTPESIKSGFGPHCRSNYGK